MYRLLGAKLQRLLESLPNFVLGALGNMKSDPRTSAVLKHSQQRQVVKSRSHPETQLFSPMKMNRMSSVILFMFRISGHISRIVLGARVWISVTLPLLQKQQGLLMKHAKPLLLNASEKEENFLEIIFAATSLVLSKEEMRAMRVLSEVMTLGCYLRRCVLQP